MFKDIGFRCDGWVWVGTEDPSQEDPETPDWDPLDKMIEEEKEDCNGWGSV